MSEVALKKIPEVPIKLDIFNFSEFPRFADSTNGSAALEKHRKGTRNTMIFSLVLWGSLIAYLLYSYYTSTSEVVWFIGAAIFAVLCSIVIRIISGWFTRIVDADAKLKAARNEHCWEIARFLSDNCFQNSTWFGWGTEAFIYNSDMCAYFSTETGEFVVYNKANIKDVSRERVHVGTRTTTTSTVSGKSDKGFISGYKHTGTVNSTSNSQELYEWHFDIFTDYMPYPKISIVLPDGEFAEDSIGKAYGVLKP